MNTKNILRTMALAMLLVTACNKEINTENTAGKGYTLPVTVNVTRQADDPASKATYNESTKKLEFSAGDKLFVRGSHDTAGKFAGPLDYDTETGKFSGTISTENEYTGTADALFSSANTIAATLLPAGYESYGFISNKGSDYSSSLILNYANAFAESKAAGVEQLSFEAVWEYSSGFTLSPYAAILNFTITGLAASTEVAVVFVNSTITVNKTVTTDASGNAAFAISVPNSTDLNPCTLTVGGNAITLVSESKTLAAGKIYNINRSALTYPIALSEVTSAYKGSVVTTDGNVYATVADAIAASKTAVAMIAYVSGTSHLAIALADDGSKNWATAKSTCESKTAVGSYSWHLPTQEEWKQMFNAFGGNDGKYTGLNTAITNAGGTALQEYDIFWSSTEVGGGRAYFVYLVEGGAEWDTAKETDDNLVRACLAF